MKNVRLKYAFRVVMLGITTAVFGLILIGGTILAQEPSDSVVTDDEVNAVANKLYCPVCENITLDTCGTAACADWRYEIRLQLEAGLTEAQIVEDFVRRFGDRVVGTPIDPFLHALSVVTPWVLIALSLVAAAQILAKKRGEGADSPTAPAGGETSNRYQDIFEQDVAGS